MRSGSATPKRRYDNRHRAAQARHTRRQVLDAARRSFARDGYAATTMQALADEAGVAVQTVYAAFGSKREVLKELFDTSIVGDDEQAALVDRPEWRAWQDEAEPGTRIDLFAHAQRVVSERTADVLAILRAAAAADREIAELHRDSERARHGDQARLADTLSRRRELRDGLDRDRAADVIWTLAGPGTYSDLVLNRGWSADDYEAWLSSHLRFALLTRRDADANPTRARRREGRLQ